jgi:hypothetical protein
MTRADQSVRERATVLKAKLAMMHRRRLIHTAAGQMRRAMTACDSTRWVSLSPRHATLTASLMLVAIASVNATELPAVMTTAIVRVTASPSFGSFGVGSRISISVQFNKAITVTGIPTLSLNTGGTASFTGGNGTSELIFTYTIAADDTSRPNLAITGIVPYATVFPNQENPISEGGAWHHSGKLWAVIKTIAGPNRAVGTQTGSGSYDDSYAYLAGYPTNQTLSGMIYKDPAIITDPTGSHEVEVLLRWADGLSTAAGYEINLAHDGSYTEIVRWHGGFGSFTVLSHVTAFPFGTMPPVTGDELKATISNDTIVSYINKKDGKGEQEINSVHDSQITTGQPGFGSWLTNQGGRLYDQTKFAFTQVAATSGTAALTDSDGEAANTTGITATFTGLSINSGLR